MTPSPSHGILVDVDGTLLTGAGSERRFILALLRHGFLGPRQVASAIRFQIVHNRRFAPHTAKKNKAYLDGLEVKEVEALAARFVEDSLVPALSPMVMRRIEASHRAEHPVALITGTPDFIAAPLARRVGASAWRGAVCAHKGEMFTGDPPLYHPFGPWKLRHALAICREWGLTLADCSAYGNAIQDAPLLAASGEAVAVDPDDELRQLADARGWEILSQRPSSHDSRQVMATTVPPPSTAS